MAHPAASPPRPRPRKTSKLRVIGLVLLALVLLLVGGVGVAYWLWSSEPAYVATTREYLDRHTPDELDAIAASLENRLSRRVTALHSPHAVASADGGATARPPASFDELQALANEPSTRVLEITLEEANAWLATRGPAWLAHRGAALPEAVSEPMIAVEAGRPVLGFQYAGEGVTQWVSLVIDARVKPGEASIRVQQVRGGRLPVPLETLAQQAADQAGQAFGEERIKRLRDTLDGQAFDPRFRLDERRIATATAFEARPDRLVVTLEVTPIKPGEEREAAALPSL